MDKLETGFPHPAGLMMYLFNSKVCPTFTWSAKCGEVTWRLGCIIASSRSPGRGASSEGTYLFPVLPEDRICIILGPVEVICNLYATRPPSLPFQGITGDPAFQLAAAVKDFSSGGSRASVCVTRQSVRRKTTGVNISTYGRYSLTRWIKFCWYDKYSSRSR